MNHTYRIALWNANGLANRSQELETFLNNEKIDIILISETHFTNKNYLRIKNYTIYDTKHPDGTAHGGTAILIKSNIKHHELPKYEKDYLQATNIEIKDSKGPVTISAVYCPPKHNIRKTEFQDFFRSLKTRFITGGDYNAKHQYWGSRLASPRGRELYKMIKECNMNHLTTGQPTYWPSDRRKIPDVLDFFITKGINKSYADIESSLDLSSDHSPIIATISANIIKKTKPAILHNSRTNWDYFREILDNQISLKISLKTADEIDEAVEYLNRVIQTAAWQSTPEITNNAKTLNYPIHIKQKIAEKRRLRRIWQNSRQPDDKNKLNRAVRELKQLLQDWRNESFQDYLQELTPTKSTDYSLWKATKRLKQPSQPVPPIRKEDGTWARCEKEKADVFANHLTKVFQPFPEETDSETVHEIQQYLEAPLQLSPPIKTITPTEVKTIIKKHIGHKKAPGYDLITGRILQELPKKGIILVTIICNAILRLGYFPSQWKVAQIILIPKPGKPPNEAASYRPISLLPILSKVMEKLLLKRLRPILDENEMIPSHQFGFRKKHASIEQVHRVVNIISQALEEKKYCSAAFLDISQAFDKVWHEGLQYKLKQKLPNTYYNILKSYLTDRYFQVKFQEEQTELYPIKSGVPQGSVLGPILYLLYTADLPSTVNTTTATFADDTAIMTIHQDPTAASQQLQMNLNEIQHWLKKWRVKANEGKSAHVTFTMRRQTCPPVSLNNKEIPQANEAKYLGMHLDRRLTWRKHIWAKRKQLNSKISKMYWLIGRKSQLNLKSKLLIYKAILKPVWTYGIQLWGTTSNSNIEIIQRFQSKTLRTITNAPWYVKNELIHRDLSMKTVKEEIVHFSTKYQKRLEEHPNYLAINLLDNSTAIKRLKRHNVLELTYRL